MLCKKCDREIPEDARICPYCGEQIREDGKIKKTENEIQKKRDLSLVACVLSVATGFVMPASLYSAVAAARALPLTSATLDFLVLIFEDLTAPLYMTGVVFMIIARVRDKNSLFAKVLQWVYIAVTALAIIVAVVATILMVYAIVSCCTELQNCPG